MPVQQLAEVLAFGLVGGLIGYATNAVAIRLLFRPLRPLCVWRLCIQGLLPRRRREIAVRVARAVASRIREGRLLSRYHDRLGRAMEKMIERMLGEQLSSSRAAALLSVLGGAGVVEGLASAVAKAVAPRLVSLVEEAASMIDLEEILVEEFESMSVEELERMFWQAAGAELRFIEVMGFLLGFIVGLFEGLLAVALG